MQHTIHTASVDVCLLPPGVVVDVPSACRLQLHPVYHLNANMTHTPVARCDILLLVATIVIMARGCVYSLGAALHTTS
jgi:hypothetical protein